MRSNDEFSIIGWVLILLFVPETKALSLEELDQGWFIGLFFKSQPGLMSRFSVLGPDAHAC